MKNKSTEQSIYEYDPEVPYDGSRSVAASQASCCLCGKRLEVTEAVHEERPTGQSMILQTWLYCPDCWTTMKRLRQTTIKGALVLHVLDL